MRSRSALLRIVLLLALGMLLRGVPHALAQPADAPAAHAAVHAVVASTAPFDDTCHDHEHAGDNVAATAPSHPDASCKISCDLGTAPLILAVQIMPACAARPVWRAHTPRLALSDAPQPDRPPPI